MKFWLHILKTRNNRRLIPARAFTLVETLVVVSIFAIIAIGIASSCVSGVKLWNRARTRDFSRTEFLLNMEKISRELRQSINVGKIGFEGSAEEVSFPTVVNNCVEKLVYKFDAQQKALLRREVKLEDALLKEEEKEEFSEAYTQRAISSSLDELSFSYFEKKEESFVWSGAWPKDKGVFMAIKLQGRFQGEEFAKTVFIPIS